MSSEQPSEHLARIKRMFPLWSIRPSKRAVGGPRTGPAIRMSGRRRCPISKRGCSTPSAAAAQDTDWPPHQARRPV